MHLSDPAQPVSPGYVPVLHQDGFVAAVVSKAREEDAAGEQGYLEGLDIDVNSVEVPGVCSDSPGNNGRKYAVEV
jgi:hypothetical protein